MPSGRKPPAAVSLDDAPLKVNMLLYGKSGIGKTVYGGGEGGADLIISCEKDKGVSAKRRGGKGKLVWCPDFDAFLAAKEHWENGGYGSPKWTMFDSLTSIQMKLIEHILKREHKKAAPGTRKLDVLQLQDHLEYQNMTRRVVNEICDGPGNVIFTAQDMNVETSEGDEAVLPALEGGKGKVSNYVAGLMTCVGYMKLIEEGDDDEDNPAVDTTTRRIYWQPRPPYFAKDWTDALGKFKDDLTLAQTWKIIQNAGVRQESATKTAGGSTRARAAAGAPTTRTRRRRAT